MPLTMRTITARVWTPDGTVPVEGTFVATIASGAATYAGQGILEGRREWRTNGGVATIQLPQSTQTGLNPDPHYLLTFTPAGARTPSRIYGPFALTADTTLDALTVIDAEPLTPSLVERALEAAAAAEAAALRAEAAGGGIGELMSLTDVRIPPRVVDELGNVISEGPQDGHVVTYDGETSEFRLEPITFPDYTDVFQPYSPLLAKYFIPAHRLTAANPNVPADFPDDGLLGDERILHFDIWTPDTEYEAGQHALSPNGEIIKRVAAGTSGTTYDPNNWSLVTPPTTGGSGPTIAQLPTPFVQAHRGGSFMAPEETRGAYRMAIAAGGGTGADVLEGDVQDLIDGTLIMMHDSTVDRTTNGTGSTAAFTYPEAAALNAAAKFPAWPPGVEPVLTLQQFVAEFGPQKVISVEPKDNNAVTRMCDILDKYNMKGRAFLSTTTNSVITAIKARGYTAWWYTTNANVTQATIDAAVAAGADVLSFDQSTPDAMLTSAVATGKMIVLGGPRTRRRHMARVTQLGLKGISSNNPIYVKATTAFRTTDPWRNGTLGVGTLASWNDNGSDMAPLVSGEFQILVTGGQEYVWPGDMMPVAGTSYKLSVQVRFITAGTASSSGLTLDWCAPDDANYAHSGTDYPNGEYRAAVNQAGLVSLLKYAGAPSTSLATIQTPAVAVGTFVTLETVTTPTIVGCARVDTPALLATTSAALASGTAVTSIPVAALAGPLVSGQQLYFPLTGQFATTSAAAAAGATSVSVASFTPAAAIPSGSQAFPGVSAADTTWRGGYFKLGRIQTTAQGGFKNVTKTTLP